MYREWYNQYYSKKRRLSRGDSKKRRLSRAQLSGAWMGASGSNQLWWTQVDRTIRIEMLMWVGGWGGHSGQPTVEQE